ncbi:MAG: hypothetical protein Q7R47_01640 [Candidatus Diapherotrites archaeon]|nr:hypothetical protein [Candidatus Diapherotrites archaeon]
MSQTTLKQVYSKLQDIDQKVSALLVKEEKTTKAEQKAIRVGKNEFAQGQFKSWERVKKDLA